LNKILFTFFKINIHHTPVVRFGYYPKNTII
jgi:hypothetical protein